MMVQVLNKQRNLMSLRNLLRLERKECKEEVKMAKSKQRNGVRKVVDLKVVKNSEDPALTRTEKAREAPDPTRTEKAKEAPDLARTEKVREDPDPKKAEVERTARTEKV